MIASDTSPSLKVGFLLLPDFPLLAFAAFIDTLGLAAGDGDRSWPIRCSWLVMSEAGGPVRASCGMHVEPTERLAAPEGFDYLVTVGGTMAGLSQVGEVTSAYLRRAARRKVPLIGVYTGVFVLARAGLMQGRRCCVSPFYRDELAGEFPDLVILPDRSNVFDRDRITSSGGVGVVQLATQLVEQRIDAAQSDKGQKPIHERETAEHGLFEPPSSIPGLESITNPQVRQAISIMDRNLQLSISIPDIAKTVGTTDYRLSRLFIEETGMYPTAFREWLRLHRARIAVTSTCDTLLRIAREFGFSSLGQFSQRYRRRYQITPSGDRRAAQATRIRQWRQR